MDLVRLRPEIDNAVCLTVTQVTGNVEGAAAGKRTLSFEPEFVLCARR